MSLRIEKVSSEQAELVTHLSRKTFYDTFIPDNTEENMMLFLDTYFTVDNIQEELSRPTNYCFVAYEDDKAIGYVNLRDKTHALLNTDNALEIGRIYVDQSVLGSGVGKALMQLSLDVALDMHKEMVWLGVWEQNPRAINFYKKWGFEKFSEHKFILGHDVQNDWLMKKELRSLK